MMYVKALAVMSMGALGSCALTAGFMTNQAEGPFAVGLGVFFLIGAVLLGLKWFRRSL